MNSSAVSLRATGLQELHQIGQRTRALLAALCQLCRRLPSLRPQTRVGAHFQQQLTDNLVAALSGRVQRGLRRNVADATYLIDATSLHLSGTGSDWAYFSSKPCGVKAHVIYDAGAECPIYAAMTPARTADITAARQMPIEPGATYVFDLAYYDFAWWAKLDAAGCRIVTRFKKNTPLTATAERSIRSARD